VARNQRRCDLPVGENHRRRRNGNAESFDGHVNPVLQAGIGFEELMERGCPQGRHYMGTDAASALFQNGESDSLHSFPTASALVLRWADGRLWELYTDQAHQDRVKAR
jgi:hypothetical protein